MVDFYQPEPFDFLEAYRLTAEKAGQPIIHRSVRTLLYQLLLIHKPTCILELGTNWGYSSAFFAATLASIFQDQKCRVITIEACEEHLAKAQMLWEEYQIPCVKAIAGRAENVLNELGHFPFIFVDADKVHYHDYLDQAYPHLSEGGLIVFDNVEWGMQTCSDSPVCQKLQAFIYKFSQYPGLCTQLYHCSNTVAVGLRLP